MFLGEPLCALNLASSLMMNGVCCYYHMKEEKRRRKEKEEVVAQSTSQAPSTSNKSLDSRQQHMLEKACENKALFSEDCQRLMRSSRLKELGQHTDSNSTLSTIEDLRQSIESRSGDSHDVASTSHPVVNNNNNNMNASLSSKRMTGTYSPTLPEFAKTEVRLVRISDFATEQLTVTDKRIPDMSTSSLFDELYDDEDDEDELEEGIVIE